MIPTRLGVKYKEGTVVGFNSRTGSILVFADSSVFVPTYDQSDFLQVSADSLKSFPEGYKWPTAHDFYSLGFNEDWNSPPFVNRHNVDKNDGLRLVTRSIKSNSSFISLQFYCHMVNFHKKFGRVGVYNRNVNCGVLNPVYYINGANCDSN